jgi:hypothetical protein
MITIRRGDDFAYVGTVREHGALIALDLTGWGVEASLERKGVPGTLALTAGVLVAAEGAITVDQTRTITAAWATGNYTLRLRLVKPDGTRISGGDASAQVIP